MLKKLIIFIGFAFFLQFGFGLAKTNITPTENNFFSALPTKNIFNKEINYNKKLYLFDMWSIECGPCLMTIPELVKLQNKLASENFTVIGLCLDNNVEEIIEFSKNEKPNYPVAMATNKALKKFPPFRGIPALFLIDSNGKLLKSFVGYDTVDNFYKEIKPFLKNK